MSTANRMHMWNGRP